MKNKRILIVAAHPDDEILGCGGTISRLINEGFTAYTLILGEGITARDVKRSRNKRAKELNELKEQAIRANNVLGTKEVFIFEFPDNRFDTVPLLDIIKVVENVKNKIRPHIIFTHHRDDLNLDHQITYKAVITATRPLPVETVREIYSFEIPSNTEWNYPMSFVPDVFFDISQDIDKKIEALKKYKYEVKDFSHPRSLEGIKLIANQWGMKVGLKYAEAFKNIRIIK